MSEPEFIPIESEMLVGSAAMVAQIARLLYHDHEDGNTLDFTGLLRAVRVLKKDCGWVAQRVTELMVENHTLKNQAEGNQP
jgi:hypothetical protein